MQAAPPQKPRRRWALRVALGGSLAAAAGLVLIVSNSEVMKARTDSQTQQLLVACLTQLVQTDAVKHRAALEELGGLVQRRVDQVAYLRLLAGALRREGKPREAMETLLRLADVLGDRDVPAGDATLSSAAVIETAIGELYRTCPADQRAALDSAIRNSFEVGGTVRQEKREISHKSTPL